MVIAAMGGLRAPGFGEAAVLAVIVMEAAKLQAGGGDGLRQGDDLLRVALIDAGAIHAGIDVEENPYATGTPLLEMLFTFSQNGDADFGELLGDFVCAAGIGPHCGIGKKHVGCASAAGCEEF